MMTDAPHIRISAMPMAEFLARTVQEGRFELIDGEIVPKMPTISSHAQIGKRIFKAFLPFEEQGIGEAFQEATFVLSDRPDWVKGSRIPDVMFVLTAKLEQFRRDIPDANDKPYILIPEIAVEIVSPNDAYSEIVIKVRRYLKDGVQLVWVVDPQVREIAVHQAGKQSPTILGDEDILHAAPVLADFSLPVRTVFGAAS